MHWCEVCFHERTLVQATGSASDDPICTDSTHNFFFYQLLFKSPPSLTENVNSCPSSTLIAFKQIAKQIHEC